MNHEKRHNLLDHGFRTIDQPREASSLLAFVALALFIGAAVVWLPILLKLAGE